MTLMQKGILLVMFIIRLSDENVKEEGDYQRDMLPIEVINNVIRIKMISSVTLTGEKWL